MRKPRLPKKDQTLTRIRPYIRKHFQVSKKKDFVPGKTRIPLTVPTYSSEEVEEALDSLLSTWVSMGKKVSRFEEMFAEYLGSKHAVMVNSGSSANLLALSVLTNTKLPDAMKPGDEIITPAVTWATTVYPIANVGCVPVLVDVDLETFNVLPDQMERAITPKTRALMPVHLLGNPCEIGRIEKTAQEHDFFLMEDACESTGAEFQNRKVGTLGDMGTFSFYMSHHISTIEGGMIVTDNDDYYEYLKAMRAFGWVRDLKNKEEFSKSNPGVDPRFLFVTHGYNFRPTEIQGGFGIHQINKLDRFIMLRRQNAQYWNRKLKSFEDVLVIPKEQANTRHVYFGYPLTIRDEAPFDREQLVTFLESKGIETRPIMAGNIEEQPVMSQVRHRIFGDLKNSKLVMRRSFFFGNHNGIGPHEREFIASCLVDFLRSVTKS